VNLLKIFEHDVINVKPEEADILFYSIFGNDHKKYNCRRKIFYSGEAIGQREDAHYNLTFDKTDISNTRLPLWLLYLDNELIEESRQRKLGHYTIPSNRDKFCSFIASSVGHSSNNRLHFVTKLSKYKKVDCGGNYLNNIGFIVPRGTNASGKINHNRKYKFCMAFENSDYPYYVTEKILDVYRSRCIPIFWGCKEIIKDFNPKTFINSNDFNNFDKLIEYIKKVDNDPKLYESYFKESIFSDLWLDVFNDPNKIFYRNVFDLIVQNRTNRLDDYFRDFTILPSPAFCPNNNQSYYFIWIVIGIFLLFLIFFITILILTYKDKK
jgi:hypothetical protein